MLGFNPLVEEQQAPSPTQRLRSRGERKHQQPHRVLKKLWRWRRRGCLSEPCFCSGHSHEPARAVRDRPAAKRFRIYEDGKEQAVVHFSNVDQPFSVVLLIDTSGSTAPFIEQIKSAAKAFVDQLRPADTIRPVYFHGEIKPLTARASTIASCLTRPSIASHPGPGRWARASTTRSILASARCDRCLLARP